MASIFLGLNVLRGEYMQRSDRTLKIYDLDRALPTYSLYDSLRVYDGTRGLCKWKISMQKLDWQSRTISKKLTLGTDLH